MDLVGTKDLYQLREDAVFNHLKANNPALSDAEIQNQIHASGNPYFGSTKIKRIRIIRLITGWMRLHGPVSNKIIIYLSLIPQMETLLT